MRKRSERDGNLELIKSMRNLETSMRTRRLVNRKVYFKKSLAIFIMQGKKKEIKKLG